MPRFCSTAVVVVEAVVVADFFDVLLIDADRLCRCMQDEEIGGALCSAPAHVVVLVRTLAVLVRFLLLSFSSCSLARVRP